MLFFVIVVYCLFGVWFRLFVWVCLLFILLIRRVVVVLRYGLCWFCYDLVVVYYCGYMFIVLFCWAVRFLVVMTDLFVFLLIVYLFDLILACC